MLFILYTFTTKTGGKNFLVRETYTGAGNIPSGIPAEKQKINGIFYFSQETSLNYQGRDSVGSYLTYEFYRSYLPLEWNCCPQLPWFQPLLGLLLPLTNHSFSVSAQVKRWTRAYKRYSCNSSSEQAKQMQHLYCQGTGKGPSCKWNASLQVMA